ncbi:MAG TPA: GNAT family N-acetyltransferase [Candidatus Saccharimonadales bacterium]|nr:GNAT family N-acetyltransferase [Candidatus Saccharimonadales bacterium]
MSRTLRLETARPEVTVRELTTIYDDRAYFEAIHEDRQHVDQYANFVSWKYPTVEAVTMARLTNGPKLRMGIWEKEDLKGAINALPRENGEAEIGYWLRKSAVGHGYATLALTALTAFLQPPYSRLYAEVHPDNQPSVDVLRRSGYIAAGAADREWGPALVFEHAVTD